MHNQKVNFVNRILIFKVLLVTLLDNLLMKWPTCLAHNSNQSFTIKSIDKPNFHHNADFFMNISSTCYYSLEDFKGMRESVERALTFFEDNVDQLVVDVGFGTRIIQGQLQLALKSHSDLPQWLQKYLGNLMDRSGTLSEQIVDVVKENPTLSQLRKHQLIPWVTMTTPDFWHWPLEGQWETISALESIEHDVKALNQNLSKILLENEEAVTGTESDTCIFEVLNCESQHVSKACRKLFLEKEHSLYSLTHQVIYTLFANKCTRDLDSAGLRPFQQKLCLKVLLEANAIAASGFSTEHMDLFAEQGKYNILFASLIHHASKRKIGLVGRAIQVCGMAGYPNFFRQDWRRKILSWQSGTGCFVYKTVPINSNEMPLELYPKVEEKVSKNTKNVNKHSRLKRYDTLMIQGDFETCSVHLTSVAISAIAVQMRHFIDTCLVQ